MTRPPRPGRGFCDRLLRGNLKEPRHQQAAQLLMKAGAHSELIAGWIEEGADVPKRHEAIPTA
jgi:hypothetical protein